MLSAIVTLAIFGKSKIKTNDSQNSPNATNTFPANVFPNFNSNNPAIISAKPPKTLLKLIYNKPFIYSNIK